ncbi:hypothetical protein HanRHA438_Chr02g0083111 [Helianthus annuus]|nr:hypothetical protein HanRHA438_Chr02g0083111 [Helianthus annuus]
MQLYFFIPYFCRKDSKHMFILAIHTYTYIPKDKQENWNHLFQDSPNSHRQKA